ncbi:MAG: PfkB family carbohydrate kinase [Salibacteraceae bacterium]
MKLVVVGTMAFDTIETPFGKADRIIGGAATYIGLAASYFNQEISLVSVIGDDFPVNTLSDLQSRGMSLDGVEQRKGEKSFFWSGQYHNDMNSRDTLDTQLNVLETFKPVVPESSKMAPFIMLGNLTPAVQMDVIRQMKAKPKLIVLDTMNFWMDIALPELKEVLKEVDVLSINDEEARQLSGEYSLMKAAQAILAMGPRVLIIKKGEHGALMFDEHNVFYAPALPLEEVFDPTGAGDTFAGGFIGYLAATQDISFENMKRAIIYGSTMASFCVEKFGTERLLSLKREEIEQRAQRFIDLTQVEIEL